MCCLVTILLVFGPRIALLAWWLTEASRFARAFGPEAWPISAPWPLWVWPLLGAIFLPWTTLAYLVVFPGGIAGLDLLWLGLALLVDLGSHGSGYRQRGRVYRR
jgi:hypothetical protein